MKKSKTRIFVNKAISLNLLIYIKDKQCHFLKNVMRIKINDEINLFDGLTGEWKSIVLSINRDNVVVKVMSLLNQLEIKNDVWLLFAPIKLQRMGIAIQKATELGVSKVIPCVTERTNIRKININNLKDNAIEAAEQCERFDIPKINNIVDLEEILLNWPNERKLIFCDEKIKNNKLIIETLIPYKKSLDKSAVLIGPEGGFSEKERSSIMNNKNTISVSLGNKVLRSDTAITVALFSIQQLLD